MPQTNGISLNGADTLIIAGRVFTDFCGAISAKFEFPNDIPTVKVGKNGNAVVALNNNGKLANGEVNLLVGSGDDQFLNSQEASYEADPPSFELLPVTFTKRSGDGDGNVTNVTYIGQGGIFKKKPMVQDQADGESEQGMVKWELIWPQMIRAIL